jgi:predicted metal-binding membrane protein
MTTSTTPVATAGAAARIRQLDPRLMLGALMVALTATAWYALWSWSTSPYARYLEHGGWTDLAVIGPLCRAVPGGEVVVPALLHASGWLLMIAAMMLPTTLPLLEIFRRVTAGRRDAGRLIVLVAVGYVCAWGGFGVVAHSADAGVLAAAERMPWIASHGWVAGVVLLSTAGLFQFSSLKYRCLEKCRTPLGFVIGHWRGKSPAREALRLGFDHGLFCVGCCWALMLLMFAVGTGSIGWMLALAAVMAAEKNLPGGQRLSAPLGCLLLISAAIVLVANV